MINYSILLVLFGLLGVFCNFASKRYRSKNKKLSFKRYMVGEFFYTCKSIGALGVALSCIPHAVADPVFAMIAAFSCGFGVDKLLNKAPEN